MKTLTIIPEDDMVVVDGEGLVITVDIDPLIHAIQWNAVAKTGQIEYKDSRRNEIIGDNGIAPFLRFADLHNTEKTRISTKEINTQTQMDIHNNLPITKKRNAFAIELPVGDQLNEILKFIDSQPVKSVEMQAVIDKSNDIKNRFPTD